MKNLKFISLEKADDGIGYVYDFANENGENIDFATSKIIKDDLELIRLAIISSKEKIIEGIRCDLFYEVNGNVEEYYYYLENDEIVVKKKLNLKEAGLELTLNKKTKILKLNELEEKNWYYVYKLYLEDEYISLHVKEKYKDNESLVRSALIESNQKISNSKISNLISLELPTGENELYEFYFENDKLVVERRFVLNIKYVGKLIDKKFALPIFICIYELDGIEKRTFLGPCKKEICTNEDIIRSIFMNLILIDNEYKKTNGDFIVDFNYNGNGKLYICEYDENNFVKIKEKERKYEINSFIFNINNIKKRKGDNIIEFDIETNISFNGKEIKETISLTHGIKDVPNNSLKFLFKHDAKCLINVFLREKFEPLFNTNIDFELDKADFSFDVIYKNYLLFIKGEYDKDINDHKISVTGERVDLNIFIGTNKNGKIICTCPELISYGDKEIFEIDNEKISSDGNFAEDVLTEIIKNSKLEFETGILFKVNVFMNNNKIEIEKQFFK